MKKNETQSENHTVKKKRKPSVVVILLALFMLCWLISWIPVTEHITLDLLPAEGSGIRIALITDLHSCWYGPGQKWLLQRVDREAPDLVLLGGDFFDDVLKEDNARITAEALAGKYRCYYVTGNHEFWSGRVPEIKTYLEGLGVTVLDGKCDTVTIGDHTIDICGIDDPTDIGIGRWREQMQQAYDGTDPSHLRLLLTHRPEMVNEYVKYDYDLIMAGHAHAGQIRIPFLNKGLYAPDQGMLAEYVNGTYRLSNGSILEVSRGLARESTPGPRFFNHPELVVIDIY